MGKGLFAATAAALLAVANLSGQPPAESLPAPQSVTPPSPAQPVAPPVGPLPAADHDCPPLIPVELSGGGFGSEYTADIDYLLWYFPKTRERTVLALNATLPNLVGPTLIDVSDQRIDRRMYSGARLTLGHWNYEPNRFFPMSVLRTSGVEAKVFFLGEQSFAAENFLSPTILRPFLDVNNRTESAVIVAAPGIATGGVAGRAQQDLWGGEANAWRNVFYNGPFTTYGLNILAGVRYLDFDPQIDIRTVTEYNATQTVPALQPFAGNRITTTELFAARNQFVGGQLGVNSRFFVGGFIVDSTFKLAIGSNRQEIHIEGTSVRTFPNGTTTVSQGALLALPSNIGRFTQDKFSQVPEFDVNVGWPVTPWLTLKFDFMAMYWSKVVRAREQINRAIDVTQIPNFPFGGGAVPTGFGLPNVPFRQSDLWIMGLGLGAEVRW